MRDTLANTHAAVSDFSISPRIRLIRPRLVRAPGGISKPIDDLIFPHGGLIWEAGLT